MFNSKLLKLTSNAAYSTRDLTRKFLSDVDYLIKNNIKTLTCNEIREMYFSLFGELKYWRSSSSGFTGFSEFLLFRTLYNTINEELISKETGDIGTDPIIFQSKSYEIGQNCRIPLTNGSYCFPDIYIKKKSKFHGVIQIKIVTGGGEKQIKRETDIFKQLKQTYPSLKGLFIVFIRSAFPEWKVKDLRDAGFEVVLLEKNNDSITNILHQFIS